MEMWKVKKTASLTSFCILQILALALLTEAVFIYFFLAS